MRKAQVFLRDDQKAALQRVSRRTGRKQSEIIRHGVDLAITAADNQPDDWKQGWLQAFGAWADRSDIDEIYEELRANNARRQADLDRHWRRK